MSTSTAFRWSHAWLWALAALVLGGFMSSGVETHNPMYGPELIGNWGLGLRGFAPIAAIAAALNVRPIAVFIRSSAGACSSGRRRVMGLLVPVLPVLWALLAAYLLGAMAFSLTQSSSLSVVFGEPAILMHGTYAGTIATWFFVGVAVGRLLPRTLGGPVVFGSAFLFTNWLPALDEPWAHQLAGTLSGCCTISTVPHPAAIATSLMVTLLGMSLLASLWAQRSLVASGALVALVALGSVPIMSFAQNNSASHLYAMEGVRHDPGVCNTGMPTICLWPEHRADLQAVVAVANDVYIRSCSDGLFRCPDTLNATTDQPANFHYHPELDEWQIRFNIAVSIVDFTTQHERVCDPGEMTLEWHDAQERLYVLTALRSGAGLEGVTAGYGYFETFEEAVKLFDTSDHAQAAAIEADVNIISACGEL